MSASIFQILSLGITLLGGIGVGSLLTTYVKDRMERKNFTFQERLKVYSGYLEALKDVQIESSHPNRQNVVYWHQRIKLIGSPDVDLIASRFYEAGVKGEEYHIVREQLIAKMQKDLKQR